MTDTPTEDAVQKAVRTTFGDAADSTVTVHASGAVSISIHLGGRHAVIDGTADEWGVSVDPDDAAAFTGHDTTVASLPLALAHARNLLNH
ncbi:hypothetical protein [Streptomyces sp. NPDC048636]|uniref:hypothetical protein n=1 Tax=Streptomyces sp. NPDC048636 TaxID=3155762 RepID=UPI00342BE177